MALNLPSMQRNVVIVESSTGHTTPVYHRWWQKVVKTLETSFNDLEELVLDIAAAQNTADTAQTTATSAQTTATSAQADAVSASALTSFSVSGTLGCTITGTDAGSDATVSITAHSRIYGDGTSVSVNSGTVTGLSYSTQYYIYYVDPSRSGGSVTYLATTVAATAVQTGDTHFVGVVTTPAAAAPDTTGSTNQAPGFGGLTP